MITEAQKRLIRARVKRWKEVRSRLERNDPEITLDHVVVAARNVAMDLCDIEDLRLGDDILDLTIGEHARLNIDAATRGTDE